MHFRVLGPVSVTAAGETSTVAGDRRRLLLAVLLAADGDAVSVDRLIDALWGSRPPASAVTSLRSHLSRLRRELNELASGAGQLIVTSSAGYRLAIDEADVDASRFTALVAEAEQLAASDAGSALDRLEEALALWRGPAYGELAEHPAIEPEAVRLERMWAAARERRIDLLLTLGRHDTAIAELEATVVDEPLAERPRAQLMVAQYRSGRSDEALAGFDALRERLRDELGLDPSPQLRQLHQRILRREADLDPVTSHAEWPPPVTAPQQRASAAPPEALIGRDEDVRAVSDLLSSAGLVTLTGPGGVGKTRLAEQAAARVRHDFPDGVVVSHLAPVRDPAGVGPALVEVLRTQHTGDRPVTDTLVDAVGTRRLLLVLDNCEHVLATVTPIVERLLRACPELTVLATSREHLRLPSERVWQVAPLAVPMPEATAEQVVATPAGALLRTRARAVDPGFEVTGTNAAELATLCRRLDGIPLAIELAAARLRTMSLQDLLARAEQRLSLLAGSSHREEGRHRTLEAVIDWSYRLLSDREARLFARLSVFAGAFPLSAAEQVADGDPLERHEIAELLGELVDRSMVDVVRRDDDVRYRLLDTLRTYAGHRLDEAGETARFRDAHARHHLAAVEQLGPRVRGPDEPDALERIDELIDELRLAHAWLVDIGDVEAALRLPVALHDELQVRLRDEVVTWVERALALPGAERHAAAPAARATAAFGAMTRGRFQRSREWAGSVLADTDADALARVRAMDALDAVALFDGELQEVLSRADDRQALADALDDDYYRALASLFRALAHRYRGDVAAAVSAAEQLRAQAVASGTATMRAWAHYTLGEALLEHDPTTAATELEAAIDEAAAVGMRLTEGVALVSLASLTGRQGDTDRALALFRRVVDHWRRLGDYTHQLTTLRNLVELLARVGADEPAALLHGAVAAGATPSFGPEADRLAAAWASLESRLGAEPAAAIAQRGQGLTPARMVEEALTALDELVALDEPESLDRQR